MRNIIFVQYLSTIKKNERSDLKALNYFHVNEAYTFEEIS